MKVLRRMNPLISLLAAVLAWGWVFTDRALGIALLIGAFALFAGNVAWAFRRTGA